MAPYQSLPKHIVLKISENLDAKGFCALLQTNKYTANVLMPFLPGLACQPQFVRSALEVSRKCGNQEMTRVLLDHGEMDNIERYNRGWGHHRKRDGPPPAVLRRIPLTLDEWCKNRDLMYLPIPAEFLLKEGVLKEDSLKK